MRLRLKQQRLLELIAASELSQNHWALRIGLSRGHWSEIVNGKHPYPSPKTRVGMLEAFGVPVEELFDIEVGADAWADLNFRQAVSDRYLIDTEIGQGGMGAVYLARDVRHGRLVAVKVIAVEAVTGVGLAQFQREIATVARLQHPNILPLFDSGEAAGHPFYVTPFVRAGSLRARLASGGRLDLMTTVRLVRGITEGLDHAHQEHVLHCDVKPENVLLHHDHPWVMDFGIARTLHSETLEWRLRKSVDVSAGTPAYVSPEQAAGERDLDARSDVYSLGCMVFEMLSGRPPFEGTSTREIVVKRFTAPPPPLRDLVPELPPGVQTVLERAMAFPKEQRHESALAFSEELSTAAGAASPRLVAAGATLARAVFRARRTLGLRPSRAAGSSILEALRDVRLAWRGLRRAPGFTLAVVLTLGLSLGANATMFGIVDRLLLRAPPHIARPEQVHRVHIARWFQGLRAPTPALSYAAFTDVRDRTRSFQAVAALEETDVSSGTGAEARSLRAQLVSGQFFQLLGVRPYLGRFFGEAEDRIGSALPVAVLSHAFWRSAYNEDPDVVGRTLMVGNLAHEIIGVAPQGFTGPEPRPVDVWAPVSATFPAVTGVEGTEWTTARGWQTFRVYARLRDGVTVEAAGADLRRAYQVGHADYENYERRAVASLAPLSPGRDPSSAGREGRVAQWLFAMAVIVLLLATANIANLVLARGLARQPEIAVRRALGVGRGRLLRMFGAETLVLAAAGALVGLGIAVLASRLVRSALLSDLAWETGPLDLRVLGFTAGATLFAALAAGFFPLLRGSRGELVQSLHGAARGQVGAPRRLLGFLLLIQTTLCTVLLATAGFFQRSLERVRSLDLGFQPSSMLYVSPSMPPGTNPVEVQAFMLAAADRLRNMPGVTGVGTTVGAPFMGNYATGVRVPGRDSLPRMPGGGPYVFRVSAGALEAMGVRLVRGRLLGADDDRPEAVPVVVLTREMASRLWPDREAVGECLQVGDGPCARVVGVVEDLHRQRLREDPFFLFFMPLGPAGTEVAADPDAILLRTAGRPEAAIPGVRSALLDLRQDLPYLEIEPYADLIAPQASAWRLGAAVFSAFGVLSLVMAAIGVYGVLTFTVRRRLPELGIRSALGATPGRILRMVLRSGLGAAAAGVGLGLAGVLALSSRLEPLLFETSVRDGMVLLAAAGSVVTFALVAALRPGLTAARADPLRALRAE